MVTRKDILKYVKEKYGTESEKLWAKYPTNEILRQSTNRKWYGVLMNVSVDKIMDIGNDFVDIINLKCDPDMITMLVMQRGIYTGYHMNKKHWITIVLDGSVPDDEIYNLIDISYDLTK